MPFWNEMEGKTLGGLPLQSLLRSEGRTAWFATTDTDQQPAVLIVFEALNDEDVLQARLDAAARVHHQNLLIIRRTGRAELDEDSVVYAVVEPFEQTLADVLQERPLTTDETRDVALSLLGALETVEAAGLYHGHVDAAGVLAVGDGIKLRSDCMTDRHGESDAPALAALTYNALTGRRFSNERDAIQLPAPFATFARAGFGPNGSLAAMRRVLTGPTSSAAVAPVSPAPAPVHAATDLAAAPPPADPLPPAPSIAAITAAPVSSGLSQQPEPRGPSPQAGIPRAALDEAGAETRKRPWIPIVALVIMAILLAIFWYMHKRPIGHTPISGEATTSSANPPAAAPPADTPPTPAQNAAAVPRKPSAASEQTAATGAHLPTRHSSAATPADAASMTGERGIWHVVAYTYTQEETAQHKAAELATRYPQLQPQVYSPSGHAPYLVSLGGGMDRQDAFARRDAARAAGMPQDTYAQNFRR